MIRNYLIVAIRNLLKNKMFSFVNIFGFSIGLASVILIITFIWHELSFDNFHPDVENTYRVYCDQPWNMYMNSTKFNVMPIPFQPEVKARYPEVEYVCRLRQSMQLFALNEDKFSYERSYVVDPDFLFIFDVPMIYGSREDALSDMKSVLISKTLSEKYFGYDNPIGKVVFLSDTMGMTIKGVFKDFPPNTHLNCEMLLPFELYELSLPKDRLNKWGNHNVQTYLNLKDGVSANAFEKKLEELIIEKRGEDIKDRYYLQNVQRIHLFGNLNFEMSSNGNIKYIYIFGAIALFIIIIASFNYMNLATARSLKRAKEVGLRKVIGASRRQLFNQFVGESLVFILLSFFIALILVEIFEPYFNEFVNREIHFYQLSFEFYVVVLVLIFFVAFVSGSYPAIYLSRFSPVKVLNNGMKGSLRTILIRNAMVILQFFISIVLIICTLTVIQQLFFIKNRNLGFETKNIISFTLRSAEARSKIDVIKDELMSIPNVLDVTSSNNLPSSITNSSSFQIKTDDGQIDVMTYMLNVNENFINFYGINVLKGESFSPGMADGEYYIINEEAEKAYGFEDAVGQTVKHGWPTKKAYKIIGVVQDFHFASLNQKIQPMAMRFIPNNCSYISVKLGEKNQTETIAKVEAVYKKISPKYPFNFSFITDSIDKSYREEKRLSSLFSFFTFIAVSIACMGLFGLIAFITDQRTKEIGIRKVLGASVQNILLLLSKNITKWILLANIIAWPVAWYFMSKWLQNFEYHIKLDVMLFVLVGVLSLIIGLLTLGVQAIKAALMNPIDTLKYE